MAFTRPTLSTIISRIKSDLKNALGLSTILDNSFEDVYSKAWGASAHTLHGNILYAINEKFFPDSGDEATVVRWGTLYNLPRIDETFAEIDITVTGTTGAVLAQDTIYVRSDGTNYKVKDNVIVPALGTITATIVSQVAGDIGNMTPGDKISLQSSLPGVQSEADVLLVSLEGADLEGLENYRSRVLDRMQNPPAGGKVTDYIGFAKSVSGVTRVWVLPGLLGEGTVGISFVQDEEVNIIPGAGKVLEVQTVMNEEAPVPADVTVFAPSEKFINPVIQLKPNTAEVQAAVIAELEDMLSREAQVKDAADPKQVGQSVLFTGRIPLSKITEAISIALGENEHILDFPVKDVTPLSGGLVVLGTPVFITLP